MCDRKKVLLVKMKQLLKLKKDVILIICFINRLESLVVAKSTLMMMMVIIMTNLIVTPLKSSLTKLHIPRITKEYIATATLDTDVKCNSQAIFENAQKINQESQILMSICDSTITPSILKRKILLWKLYLAVLIVKILCEHRPI